MPSPFIDAGDITAPDTLALLQLKRDQITPVRLSSSPNAVLHTRFGSYPHKTLLNVPWGSQVLASRTSQPGGRTAKRRKLSGPEKTGQGADEKADGELVILGPADAGFAHVLPPTPELWTQSLPHRTQVVYTPDYSYILQRLRVRPGSVVIEAGAGSGSFTHAAARAVYNGGFKGSVADGTKEEEQDGGKGTGRVYSYEYHKPRAEQLEREIQDHGFDGVVITTHRDVYEDGFVVDAEGSLQLQATAVFLDLPAPWLALKYLTRLQPVSTATATNGDVGMADDGGATTAAPFRSPLAPQHTVYICTFSPCIEQVQQTVTALTNLGWQSIETVTLAHHDIITRRERIGVAEEGSRDGNPAPASVEEAVNHLRKTRGLEEEARQRMKEREAAGEWKRGASKKDGGQERGKTGKERRIEELEKGREGRKLWKEGRLVTRTEPELKGHTSFLTFAVLPREWSEADEEEARRRVEREHPAQDTGTSKPGKHGQRRKGRGTSKVPLAAEGPEAVPGDK